MIKLNDKNFFSYKHAGKFISSEPWIHPERTINTFEIIFVLDGVIYIEENDTQYELHPNEILVLEPHKQHKGFRRSENGASFYWFHFLTDLKPPCKVYSGNEFYDIKYLLKKLLHTANTATQPSEAADTAGLMIFLELSHISDTLADTNSALLGNICEWIRINTENDIHVNDVAQHFGYNADYLGKLFRRAYGTGLKEYISSRRMNHAKDLLLTTDLSIKQLAARLGFKNSNTFVKFFIYHEEISPVKFRNKYYNTHINNR